MTQPYDGGLIPQPHGGALRPPIRPGEVLNPEGKNGTNFSIWTRKAVRRMLVNEVAESIEQLREWINGRAKILIGFKNYEELAERFHEIYERKLDPEADRVPAWETLPQERRDLLIECMREITGGKLTMRQIAINIGVQGQQFAMELAMRYGLGTQMSNVDEEGNVLPGVVYLPPPEIHRRFSAQQERQLEAGNVVVDAEFEYVEEDLTAVERGHQEDRDDPGPVEETVHPAVVELVKRRRKRNGNGEK